MPRRIQTNFVRYNNNRIVVMGDSLSAAGFLGYTVDAFYPTQLQNLLNNAGCHCMTRNYGVSGETSGQIAQRGGAINYLETPEVVIVWAGTNDFFALNSVGVLPYKQGLYSGLSCSGSTATFVGNYFHGLKTGDVVIITGATSSFYNGTFTASVIDPVSIQYQLPSSSLAHATGQVELSANPLSVTGSMGRSLENLQAIIKCAKFNANGYVTSQNDLGVGLTFSDKTGMRYVVLNDTDPTGGCPAITPNMLPTITGSSPESQSVWEYRLATTGSLGWGRVATSQTPVTNVKQIVVVGNHYLNWMNGAGDTQTSSYYRYNSVNGLRSAQISASMIESSSTCQVAYSDLYNFFSSRISVGLDVQGSNSWQVADGNLHLNPYGLSLAANCIYNTIASQSNWIQSLS